MFANITKQFTVTQIGVTQTGEPIYKVDLQVHGSFAAFSDPNTGYDHNTPINVNGPISGVNTYYLDSPQAPNPSAVPVNEPDATGTGTILNQLFGGQQTADPGHPESGNLWVFKYQHAGNVMIQNYQTASDPLSWGDVVSH